MIIASQGVVLATAMLVSTTVLFLAFSKDKSSSSSSTLRSCLLISEEKKKEKKKMKKRVKFAENVKETKGRGEEYRRQKKEEENSRICRNEIPANRIALYNGILRDRVHRMECSY
ncbi:uncharacterized protein LOC126682354 [Mercurialis annua]|uniref:uncharacterized protein LOC126682354 n=1 Tax=Mercurialis annua TaxID=3986 RepID=UPI00215EDBAD|nr:uncharacterized protein LOC126682354 [Mercurialis annua]